MRALWNEVQQSAQSSARHFARSRHCSLRSHRISHRQASIAHRLCCSLTQHSWQTLLTFVRAKSHMQTGVICPLLPGHINTITTWILGPGIMAQKLCCTLPSSIIRLACLLLLKLFPSKHNKTDVRSVQLHNGSISNFLQISSILNWQNRGTTYYAGSTVVGIMLVGFNQSWRFHCRQKLNAVRFCHPPYYA